VQFEISGLCVTSVISWGNKFQLSEMSVLNAYLGNTLLNFERYKAETINPKLLENSLKNNAEKSTAELVMLKLANENPKYFTIQKVNNSWIEINKGKYKIGQLTRKSNDEFTVKQYFFSDKFVYILTASSRKGLTPEITRFLNSLIFKPNADNPTDKNATAFSDLKRVKIEFTEDIEPEKSVIQNNAPNKLKKIDKSLKPILFISNSSVPYTPEASETLVRGVIRLKTTFSENGQITKIIVRKSLEYNLVQNAFLTVLRMKFLPALKKAKPISVVKTIDYEFTGY
jgi:Gram-negative bacterial TonB protein C-terminal